MCVCGHVFLNEERTVSTATHKGDKRGVVWFLNTGTTNHMTSLVNTFAELDRLIFRKVRFADGSVVEIQAIIFTINGGDHKAFTNVFFILALKSSVVRVGQLNECWYYIVIRRGMLTVRDQCS